MQEFIRLAVMGLGATVLVLALAVIAGLGYRAIRQHRAANATAIRTPDGIDEGRFVRLRGVDQWITIRGQRRDNPVLLKLDGGPGAAASPFIPSPFEQDFTVVEWDQPGSGRTFARAGSRIDPGLTSDAIVQDGVELAEYLRGYLHKPKIGILASSWGTSLGVPMIKERPELFYAYVGTGQLVSMQDGETLNYQHVLAKAEARHDQSAIAELRGVGAPPYRSVRAFRTQRKWAMAYEAGGPSGLTLLSWVAFAPRYSIRDAFNWFSAFLASQQHFFGATMNGPAMQLDLRSLGPDFNVPFFVFQGTDDDYAPFELARDYVASIRAPDKAIVAVSGAGHYAALSHADELRRFLLSRVRPADEGSIAVASHRATDLH